MTRAARRWLGDLAARERISRGGYFGSYARGDDGVGSDLDVVLCLKESDLPFDKRAAQFDTSDLPVPADLLVYTEAELEEILNTDSRFARILSGETVWVVDAPGRRSGA